MKNFFIAIFSIVALAAALNHALAPAGVEYVGHVYAPDAITPARSLIKLQDGRLSVSICTAEEIKHLTRFNESDCILPQYVASGSVLVKSVQPEYRARVRAAMQQGTYYTGLDLQDGYVKE